MIAVLGRSTLVDDRPGLREAARLWLAWGPRARARVAAHAATLARPSLRPSSIAAVGRTGARAARAAGPGLVEDARRRLSRTPLGAGAAIRHVQAVVEVGGPTFVKLGQFVATAQGLLPDEWVEAFGWCRDSVAPLPPGAAEARFEEVFDVPWPAVLAEFDPVPLGAASIAQAHAGRLHDGTEVVIKIRRPGLPQQFARDLRTMALAAAAAERTSKAARVANLPGFVELFAQLVLEEIDFRFEAVNQLELGLASEDAGHDFARYPRPVPHLVSADVLVMTRVPGVPYTEAMATYPDAVDGERLLRLAITSVLEHTLIYGVFHGDLHAGNVLIDAAGDFGIIDFGIAGRLDDQQRASLVRFMLGFARNDTRMQLRGLQGFRAIPDDADLDDLTDQFETRLAALDPAVLDRSATVTVDQLSELLSIVIKTLAANGFRLPKELVLFFKNLLYLNGFAATLAPGTNLFGEIEPVFSYFMTRYPAQFGAILSDVDVDADDG
jgi:ubiquinone biosynthesis protein